MILYRILLLIIFGLLCFCGQGWSYTETFYLSTNGDGTLPEVANANTCWDEGDFNTAANWDTDDQDDGKLGANDALIILDDNGDIDVSLVAQKAPATGVITIMGEVGGTATISNTASHGILIYNKSGFTITNLNIHGCTGSGLSVALYNTGTSNVEDILVDDVTSWDNTGSGIAFSTNENTSYTLSGTIQNSTVYSNDGAGVYIHGALSTVNITNVISYDNAKTGTQWGILANGWATEVAAGGTNWTAQANNEYSYTMAGAYPVVDVCGPNYDDGWYTEGSAVGALNPGEFKVSGTDLYVRTPDSIDPDAGASDMFIIHRWATGVTISQCTSYDTNNPSGDEGVGIGLEKGIENSVIERCKSYSNGEGAGGHGIIGMVNRNNTIRYCTAYGNDKFGFSYQRATGIKIQNCVAYNNCLTDATRAGFNFMNFGDSELTNCSSYNPNGIGVKNGTGVTAMTVTNTYNDVWGNATDYSNVVAGTGEISSDPLFSDATGDDFTLQLGSPCIDVGTLIPLTRDYEDNLVPQSYSADIGAYEAPGGQMYGSR